MCFYTVWHACDSRSHNTTPVKSVPEGCQGSEAQDRNQLYLMSNSTLYPHFLHNIQRLPHSLTPDSSTSPFTLSGIKGRQHLTKTSPAETQTLPWVLPSVSPCIGRHKAHGSPLWLRPCPLRLCNHTHSPVFISGIIKVEEQPCFRSWVGAETVLWQTRSVDRL